MGLILADVMDLRIIDVIQKHQRDDRHRTVLGNLAGLVERDFLGLHAAEVDPLGKAERSTFGAEACESVDSVMAEAAVSVARCMVEDKELIWERFIQSQEREVKN